MHDNATTPSLSKELCRDIAFRDDGNYVASEYLYACETLADENFKRTPRYTDHPRSQGT